MPLTLLALLLAALEPQSCDMPIAERTRQLALGYEAFDEAPAPYGWRDLSARGCTDAAVALLRAYRSAHLGKLTVEQKRESAFHIGQTYAFANRRADALRSFIAADAEDAPEEWRAYVAAHIAFFRHDEAWLADARRRYAAVSGPGSMRLKFIDGFVKCPDKSYMEAAHCAM